MIGVNFNFEESQKKVLTYVWELTPIPDADWKIQFEKYIKGVRPTMFRRFVLMGNAIHFTFENKAEKNKYAGGVRARLTGIIEEVNKCCGSAE